MDKELEATYKFVSSLEPEEIRRKALVEKDPDKREFLVDLYNLRLGEVQKKIVAKKKFVI